MTAHIDYTYSIKESVIIFKFNWEFTNENAWRIFDRVVADIMENGKFDVIINMKSVDTINSRVAWWFAWIYEKIDIFWWNVYVTNMNNFVDDTLDLLWMYLFLRKATTEEEALKWLKD
ncbi:MAG: hypothetical protein ACD_3C00216G0003 [uncultured bacterium (gcode 4)]|uniref:STAS/SEC14 domain-containing protein n=1 Tax=uncultured bacterium (gcode 4) TaxID=1234023 RepID=K2GVL8_9BACT|nr:MAG: hypothetical protein ACD_3C00216G0003 [uncultured bacterium (gcode 4)]